MAISDQLIELNTNLGTINTEVNNQADLISQIKNAVENLPDAGGSGGTSEDLEALGALCEWQVTSDSGNSEVVVTIVNYHPSYFLYCIIEDDSGYIYDEQMIPPDDSYSFTYDGVTMSDNTLYISNVRWTASGE